MNICNTDRLKIRNWQMEDLVAFHVIWGDPIVIWWGANKNMAESEVSLNNIIIKSKAMPKGCGWWAVERGGQVVGNVMLQPAKSVPGEYELGWYFARAHQRKGYATEAARAIIRRGFDNYAIGRMIAPIVTSNEASRRVAQKLNMKIGRQIEYAGYLHDVWVIVRTEEREHGD